MLSPKNWHNPTKPAVKNKSTLHVLTRHSFSTSNDLSKFLATFQMTRHHIHCSDASLRALGIIIHKNTSFYTPTDTQTTRKSVFSKHKRVCEGKPVTDIITTNFYNREFQYADNRNGQSTAVARLTDQTAMPVTACNCSPSPYSCVAMPSWQLQHRTSCNNCGKKDAFSINCIPDNILPFHSHHLHSKHLYHPDGTTVHSAYVPIKLATRLNVWILVRDHMNWQKHSRICGC